MTGYRPQHTPHRTLVQENFTVCRFSYECAINFLNSKAVLSTDLKQGRGALRLHEVSFPLARAQEAGSRWNRATPRAAGHPRPGNENREAGTEFELERPGFESRATVYGVWGLGQLMYILSVPSVRCGR